MAAVALMTAFNVHAQRIQVVDNDGNGIPLVSVLTEDGTYIGTTGLDGVLADVKGAAKVAVTHVAYKPQLITVASLQGGLITMEDIGYDLEEIVVKPKPLIYVEVLYRVYVYRNDSLCYFLSGIMPNAYDIQKKKIEITVSTGDMLHINSFDLDLLHELLIVCIESIQGIHHVMVDHVGSREVHREEDLEVLSESFLRGITVELLRFIEDEDWPVGSDNVDGPSGCEFVPLAIYDSALLVLGPLFE